MTQRSVAAGHRSGRPEFVIRLSSTPRGARLARRLAEQQLTAWGFAYGSSMVRDVALVTAELASNAITHGRLPGRDFRLAVGLLPRAVRIEVTDTRPERLLSALSPALGDATAGRGLLLVDAYADRWGCTVRDTCTKTVWAEVGITIAL
ncbi:MULTISPECIES: ATP-binding protein [Streptomyces]|jgi:anti-sigma regulatory factor (Ser/Thr protein kinase)|uniref:ATP-binding protein n=1 Tax=Streptomyces TaxID=1883 RepID=UPI0002C6CBB0|nr:MULTISPECIES: ATP-binding protein [Streptomyces]AGJ54066.1 putative regulatory protein [Streptomyces sp. PAMC 26508]WSK31264.1 ATP-binding protein [[Kitasatospora] papulosa]